VPTPSGKGAEARTTETPSLTQLPESEKKTRVVFEHRLWEMGEDLRRIKWPRRWLDRLGSGLLALSVAALLAAWSTTSHNSAVFGVHNGYYALGGIAGFFALVCFAAEKGDQAQPKETTRRVVRRMESLGWITPPEPPTSVRERLSRAWGQVKAR
jgi:peptidoglycan/LPS O-acetylase OafA/YrhL